ncbi:small membrane protein [Klebsiella oxytoca]|uniref:Small membrane protein n=1 Tax=Klebsiella oxytoca TaxID=571 RepID=A0A6B8MTE9_KLEOX|nr:small membrane protein [Klebsiella oxytoca]QGN37574.1 small membrane protein [Klebsiella oxytoca]
MSGILLFIVAVVLLGVAVYSLGSYIRERRSAQLPTHKTKK